MTPDRASVLIALYAAIEHRVCADHEFRWDPMPVSCTITGLLRDCLDLIKEATPRVMSLAEVVDWCNKPMFERDPVFLEFRPGDTILTANYWTQDMIFNPKSETARDVYNKVLRCWTGRPTPEQMREVKWGG